MRKRYLMVAAVISILLISGGSYLFLTHSEVEWKNQYGRGWVRGMVTTQDDNCIIIGDTLVEDEGMNGWLLKLDSDGDELFNFTYGDGEKINYYFCDIIACRGEGYLIAGDRYDHTEKEVDHDIFLIKIDNEGNIIWNRTYGRDGIGFTIRSLIEIKDGYLLVGNSNDAGIIMKVDEEGDFIFKKRYEYESGLWFNDAVETEDEYFVVGRYFAYTDKPEGKMNYLLYKVDRNGNVSEILEYEGDYDGEPCSINGVSDGYLIAGDVYDKDNKSDIALLKIDRDGKRHWMKKIGGENSEILGSLTRTEDDFLLTAEKKENILFQKLDLSDYYIVKVDESGDIVWEREYGKYMEHERGIYGVQLDEDKYISAGYSRVYDHRIEIIGFHEPENPWTPLNLSLVLGGSICLAGVLFVYINRKQIQ